MMMCVFQIFFNMSHHRPYLNTRPREDSGHTAYSIARKISELYERVDVPVFATVLGNLIDQFSINDILDELARMLERRHSFKALCAKSERGLMYYTQFDSYVPTDTAPKNILVAMNQDTTRDTLIRTMRTAHAQRVVLIYTVESSRHDDFMYHLKNVSDMRVPVDSAKHDYGVVSVLLSNASVIIRTCRAMCNKRAASTPAWMILEDAFREQRKPFGYERNRPPRSVSPLRVVRGRSRSPSPVRAVRGRSRSASPVRVDRVSRFRGRELDEDSIIAPCWESPVIENELFDITPLLLQMRGTLEAALHILSEK